MYDQVDEKLLKSPLKFTTKYTRNITKKQNFEDTMQSIAGQHVTQLKVDI